MIGYPVIRDWVDGCWRSSSYSQGRLLLVPVVLTAVFLSLTGFQNTAVTVIAIGIASLWSLFVFWRGALSMRSVMNAMKDEPYDREGKYRLSKEYWGTGSAAATRRRKKNVNG